MNWDQIEIKWAEMARRVRADLPLPVALDKAGAEPSKPTGAATPRPDVLPVTGA